MRSKWYERGRQLLPYLLICARAGDYITYKQAARLIGWKRDNPHALGYVLSEIRTECLEAKPKPLPLINVLVVSSTSGISGEMFLPEGPQGRTKDQLAEDWQKEYDRVCGQPSWRSLLLGMKVDEPGESEKKRLARVRATIRGIRRGGGGESWAHRRLKLYIAEHLSILGLKGIAVPEYPFISGDRCDVVVDLESRGHAVIEVKSDYLPDELLKGVYQAVKYRALMEAEEGEGKPYPVRAFLVAHRIPNDIKKLAWRLAVKTHEISAR